MTKFYFMEDDELRIEEETIQEEISKQYEPEIKNINKDTSDESLDIKYFWIRTL